MLVIAVDTSTGANLLELEQPQACRFVEDCATTTVSIAPDHWVPTRFSRSAHATLHAHTRTSSLGGDQGAGGWGDFLGEDLD